VSESKNVGVNDSEELDAVKTDNSREWINFIEQATLMWFKVKT